MIERLISLWRRKPKNINYHDYIQSDDWKVFAENFKKEHGYSCALCHASGYIVTLHVHHNTYERLGNELDHDLVVLCEDCHRRHHENGGRVGYKPKLTKEEFLRVLARQGIVKNNDDPYGYYELGKGIIQHIIDGYDAELYDYYNKINIEVLECARLNKTRRAFKEAMLDDFSAFDGNEYYWRSENDYWEGW